MSLMKRVALALIALVGGRAMATGTPEVEALLAKMRTAYSSVKSAHLSCTFEQFGGGKKVTMKSECSYLAPSDFRMVSTGLSQLKSNGYVVVADGKWIRVDGLPGGTVRQMYGFQNMVIDMPQTNLEVFSFWDWRRQLSTEQGANMSKSTFRLGQDSWNGKTYTVLEETASPVRVRYFIDPKTSLIWKVEQYNLKSKSPYLICSIDKMELNAKVDAKQFVIEGLRS